MTTRAPHVAQNLGFCRNGTERNGFPAASKIGENRNQKRNRNRRNRARPHLPGVFPDGLPTASRAKGKAVPSETLLE